MENTNQYPRKANATERSKIINTFGENWLPIIELFLGDILDIYPFEQWNRDSNGFKYMTIGASCRKNNFFYAIGQDGSIYLNHAYMVFPVMATQPQNKTI